MPFLFLFAGVAVILFGASGMGISTSGKLFGLKDVLPKDQKGTFKRDYDLIFSEASDKTGVPFALLKAHSIQESSIKADAFLDESGNRADRKGWASRGLMQILWWPGSERWKKYGYADKDLGTGGVLMFDPKINVDIAAQLIRDNLKACKGNLRDAVNMYNTGKKEADFAAPGDYVNKVIKYYETILGEKV